MTERVPNSQPFDSDTAELMREVNTMLREGDEITEMATAELEFEGRVIKKLIEAGLDIPNPSLRGISIFEAEVLFTYCRNFQLELGKTFLGVPVTNLDRSISLLYIAGDIASTLAYYEDPVNILARGDDKQDKSTTWFKIEAQIRIIDDESITAQDKAIILDAFDDLIPVAGLDVTDQQTIDEVRATDQLVAEKLERIHSLRDQLVSIFRNEMIPRYGEHDDYQVLIGSLARYIELRREDEPATRFLLKDNLAGALTVARRIGIPDSELDAIIERMVDLPLN